MNRERRDVLRGLGVGAFAGIAGCVSGGEDSTSDGDGNPPSTTEVDAGTSSSQDNPTEGRTDGQGGSGYSDSGEFPFDLSNDPDGRYWDPYRLEDVRDVIRDDAFYDHYQTTDAVYLLEGDDYEERCWVPDLEMIVANPESGGVSGVHDGDVSTIVAAFEDRGFDVIEDSVEPDEASEDEPVILHDGGVLAFVRPSRLRLYNYRIFDPDMELEAALELRERYGVSSSSDSTDEPDGWLADAKDRLGRPMTARIFTDQSTLLDPGERDTGIAIAWQIDAERVYMRTIFGLESEPAEEDVETLETGLTEEPPDIDPDRMKFELFELVDRYEHRATTTHGQCVVFDWQTSADMFNLLDPEEPLPVVSLQVEELEDDQYRVIHAGGDELEADKTTLQFSGDETVPTETQFSDEYDVVSPGDSVVVEADISQIGTFDLLWENAAGEEKWIADTIVYE